MAQKIESPEEKFWEEIYLEPEKMQYADDTRFVMSKSPKMQEILHIIMKVANLPATIMLQGESGTGKELLARCIHKWSDRKNFSFISANIASVQNRLMESFLFGYEKGIFPGAPAQRSGKFELAHNGTLFLDEIGDLQYDLQAKLLRFIQDGEFERLGGNRSIKANVRLIVATNKNLEKLVQEGRFREDLYYRLNIIPIKLPPLRERKEDISPLAKYFLSKYNEKFHKSIKGLSISALSALSGYNWPGNIRELESLIERLTALVNDPIIFYSDIPVQYLIPDSRLESRDEIYDYLPSDADYLRKACSSFERNYIFKIMEKVQWNRKEAAKRLGIPISTLKYKLSRKDIYKVMGGGEKYK